MFPRWITFFLPNWTYFNSDPGFLCLWKLVLQWEKTAYHDSSGIFSFIGFKGSDLHRTWFSSSCSFYCYLPAQNLQPFGKRVNGQAIFVASLCRNNRKVEQKWVQIMLWQLQRRNQSLIIIPPTFGSSDLKTDVHWIIVSVWMVFGELFRIYSEHHSV